MTDSTWTAEQDAALCFAGALGMSARKIGLAVGKSRNAVIGRAGRQGWVLACNEHRSPRVKRKVIKTRDPSQRRVRRPRIAYPADAAATIEAWQAEGISIIEMSRRLGVHYAVFHGHLKRYFGYQPREMRRFTADEDAKIRLRYSESVRLDDIACELGRDAGTVRQRIYKLGLTRDPAMTIARRNFGAWVLKIGDPIKVREIIDSENARARDAAERAHASFIAARLRDLDNMIANGIGRNHAIRKIRATGLTLEAIGSHLGVTRERIRQICE